MALMNELQLAAQHGNINSMYELVKQNPSLLKEINNLGSFEDNPLHTAATFGQTQFALEFMIIFQAPLLVRKLNRNGFTPMHLAVKYGHLDTMRGFFSVGKKGHLVRVKGTGGFTPLHTAVVEGRDEMLRPMLAACPSSIKDLTNHRESPLHLAVKNNQLKAFRVLVERVSKFNLESIFLWKDDEGHTVLHHMILHKRLKMLRGVADYYCYAGTVFGINVTDAEGRTALDILQELENYGVFAANVVAMRKILHQSGGIGVKKPTKAPLLQKSNIFQQMVYNSMSNLKQMDTNAQNGLLVVAATVAAVTFLVGQTSSSIDAVYLEKVVKHPSLLANDPYFSVLVLQSFNLVVFMSSVFLVFILTLESPLKAVRHTMLSLMICSYLFSTWPSFGILIFGLPFFLLMMKIGYTHYTRGLRIFEVHNDSDDDVGHLNDNGAV